MAMGHITYDFTAGDTGSKLRVTFIDKAGGRKILPFNGVYNADLLVKPADSAVAVRRAMTVLSDDKDGEAEYQFTGSELAEGDLVTQAEVIVISSGEIVSELGTKVFKVGPKL